MKRMFTHSACLMAEITAGGIERREPWWAGPLSIRVNALTFCSNVSGQKAELAGYGADIMKFRTRLIRQDLLMSLPIVTGNEAVRVELLSAGS